jgi:hypothetical protein
MSSPSISIYNIQNAHEFSLLDCHEAEYYRSLLQNKSAEYIENISAEINLLKVDNHIYPLLIASDNYQDSYVCSPYGHYISLALESLHFIKKKWLQSIVKKGLESFGRFVKSTKVNSTVYINHSFFSTDLHPHHLSTCQIEHMISFLKNKFPKHALIFRSINKNTCSKLHNELKFHGFTFIATRQVHITQVKNPDLFKTRIIKSDLKLWHEKQHQVISQNDFTEDDELHVLKLCHCLALDHHSKWNPKASTNLFRLLKNYPLFQMKALKLNGKIEGIAGYHIKDNVLLCSVFGYDKLHPNKNTIYRLLSTMLLLEAANQAETFHQSAGASFYKSIRRAKRFQEYQAVYTKHLPIKQKIGWTFLKAFINTFAVPFMQKY